ncbi:MAG: GntP family permease [Saprospiraceae bacterium]|nr:GntP family permease [Saprospiraceae bacterium]
MFYTAFLLVAAIASIILLSARFRFNVFFALLFVAAATGVAAGLDAENVVGALKTGIGSTVEKIGLLIILGITLGVLLEKSGAMDSLACAVLRRTGQRKAPLALSIVGYLVGLPIFCDSGFVVLSGLLRSLSERSPGQRLWMVIALSSSLYAVHCLVPPHPGITAAAGILRADLGLVMLLGGLVALPVAAAGYFLGKWLSRWPTVSFEDIAVAPPPHAARLRPVLAMPPILVPIMLIGLKSMLSLSPDYGEAIVWWPLLQMVGDPVVALFIGILFCIPLLRKMPRADWAPLLDTALAKSGNILLLTAAGGAFGEVIKALNIGEVFGQALATSGLGLLVPFLLAAVLKTAQGSSTIAVISAAGILAPFLPALGCESDAARSLVLLAMGAGSMVVSHTNDSYFWVVSKFGELDEMRALKTYTLTTAVMGATGLLGVWVLWLFV